MHAKQGDLGLSLNKNLNGSPQIELGGKQSLSIVQIFVLILRGNLAKFYKKSHIASYM